MKNLTSPRTHRTADLNVDTTDLDELKVTIAALDKRADLALDTQTTALRNLKVCVLTGENVTAERWLRVAQEATADLDEFGGLAYELRNRVAGLLTGVWI
jgi:hypothetical protein